VNCPHCGAPNRDDARFCGACGRATHGTEPSRAGATPAPGTAPDLAGREIAGRYRILAKLGEGGMGAVYRGEQISLKRKCAIKLLKPELSADPGLVRRFNAEAELVARLSHPNVVNIYDFGQDADGTLFIAMEFIEGRPLRAVMNADGPLPARRAVAIAAQVASSLTDAHAHGIVHRDLKPDNVMLTERGREKDVVRVLDFGIAKLRDENKQTVQAMTQAGDLVGTPQYMAPEQIRGDKVDGRTDVYALGAVLYEMVTGRLPFEGPTVMAILSKHLTETPQPPSVRRPDLGIPPALDALIMESLAKDAAQRVASMEQVGERLAAIATQLGGSASQPFVVPAGVGGGGAWQPGTPTQQSAMPAMQPTPMPYAALSPIPGAQAAPAMPTGTPPPVRAIAEAKKSRKGVWIAIGAIAIAGIAAGAVIATRGGEKAGSPSVGSEDDPWASHPGSGTGTGTGTLGGSTYTAPAGWSLIVPEGFGTAQAKSMNGTQLTGFEGHVNGAEAAIAVIELPGLNVAMDDDEAMRAARDFATTLGGTLFQFDFAPLHGARRLRAIYDVKDSRLQAVLYLGTPTSVVVLFGTDRDHFDATDDTRRELFDRRVTPP
jgi:serine/threonine-protein kinase